MKYNIMIEDVSVEAVFNKLGGANGARNFLADKFVLVEASKPKVEAEPELDLKIQVDRGEQPVYPEGIKKLLNSDQEIDRPGAYDLYSHVWEWNHDGQKRGKVAGKIIYSELLKDNSIASCLNLQDGYAIQAKGIEVFRKVYRGKKPRLWGTVLEVEGGVQWVPFLYENGTEVLLGWANLEEEFGLSEPALRFKKLES